MATSGGPDCIDSGLVACYDAANKLSYPGSGTSWYDLSNTRNNGTLTNGPAFNSNAVGNILFDGIDDYVPLSLSVTLGNTFTINSFVKLTADNSDTSIFGSNANGADNWFGIYTNKIFVYFTESADINNNSLSGNTTLSNGVWYYVTTTINGSTVTCYLNGVLDGTRTVAYTIGSWTDVCAIGRRSFSTAQRYFYGNIANLSCYNRVLTASEILQNYNDTKTRFGILS